MSDKQCRGPECERTWVARQLCGTHYQQLKSGKGLTPIKRPITLEESVKEFIPTISADKLTTGNVTYYATTSAAVTKEAVRDSATSYNARVEAEAFDKWLREHDAEVLMLAANTFAQSSPYSWQQDAAYSLEGMARNKRDGNL